MSQLRSMLMQWVLPVVLAVTVAGLARRAGSLTSRGAVSAAVVGTLALWAGWPWALYLVLWFVLASLASRIARHPDATSRIVAKGGARDAWQVLANGGVFSVLAGMYALHNSQLNAQLNPQLNGRLNAEHARGFLETATPDATGVLIALAAASALTAAGADTLATEVGTRCGGTPWSLRTGEQVPPGTSGAVSVAGTAALIVTAILLASLAVFTRMVPAAPGSATAAIGLMTVAGVGGACVDTLMGAWIQQERWCSTCGESTEQSVHVCGAATTVYRGWPWLTNDGVNLLCTFTAAVLAAALAWRWHVL